MAKRKYWLVKSEPDVYSLDDLERDGTTCWDGVRNYTARNFMRDEMKIGDGVLYYHSRVDPMAIVGVAKVSKESHPDRTQFDKKSHYYDPKATPESPRWFLVDITFAGRFEHPLTLSELKGDPKLEGLPLIQKGQRLSVQPVEEGHWKHILKLAGFKE